MNKKVVGIVCVASALFALHGDMTIFADDGTQFSIDVSEATLQFTVPNSASIELSPTSSSAMFGSANVTVNVATNNATGYRILMTASTTDLVHGSMSNTVIPTLSSQASEVSFPANAWGYKVAGDVYAPVLTSNAPSSWIIENPTNGSNHVMTLAAKVDGAKPAGIYTNTLTFQAVANPNVPKDTVIFNGNGADSGSMESQVVWQDEQTKLNANSFSKNGYVFNGWNTYADGGGVGYGDEDSFVSVISASAKNVTLYAQWICNRSVNTCDGVPSVSGESGSGGYVAGRTLQRAFEEAYLYNHGNFDGHKGMYVPVKDNQGNILDYFEATEQSDYNGMASTDLRFAIQDASLLVDGDNVCNRTTVIGSEAYVLDLRDFTSYHIVKAADGRCWMQDNLALDPTISTVKAKINPDTTNASQVAINNYLTSSGNAPYTGWTTEAVSYETTTSFDDKPRIKVSYKDVVPVESDPLRDSARAGNWKVGVYYNFCAASVGTYCYGYGQGVDPNPDSLLDLENDICPAGWRLPTGGGFGTGSEFIGLVNAYPGIDINTTYYERLREALHIPLSGYYGYNMQFYLSQYADFWSATYKYVYSMYELHFTTSQVLSADSGRYSLISIRCIAK